MVSHLSFSLKSRLKLFYHHADPSPQMQLVTAHVRFYVPQIYVWNLSNYIPRWTFVRRHATCTFRRRKKLFTRPRHWLADKARAFRISCLWLTLGELIFSFPNSWYLHLGIAYYQVIYRGPSGLSKINKGKSAARDRLRWGSK